MSEELVNKQLRSIGWTHAPDRTKIALEQGTPEHTPEGFGAFAGVGYHSSNPHIHVSVYIFSSWSKHQSVSQQLKDEVTGDGVHVAYGDQWPDAVCWSYPRIDGPKGSEARFALGDIVSAFSGDE